MVSGSLVEVLHHRAVLFQVYQQYRLARNSVVRQCLLCGVVWAACFFEAMPVLSSFAVAALLKQMRNNLSTSGTMIILRAASYFDPRYYPNGQRKNPCQLLQAYGVSMYCLWFLSGPHSLPLSLLLPACICFCLMLVSTICPSSYDNSPVYSSSKY